jgi:hypothetical protein
MPAKRPPPPLHDDRGLDVRVALVSMRDGAGVLEGHGVAAALPEDAD